MKQTLGYNILIQKPSPVYLIYIQTYTLLFDLYEYNRAQMFQYEAATHGKSKEHRTNPQE